MATTFLKKKDNAKSLVTNNPLTSVGLSITITTSSGSKFPASGAFVVTVWDNTTYSDPGDDPAMEKILIDSISGDTMTVNASGRGYDGTSASAHAQGSRISLLGIAKHISDLDTAVNSIEAKTDNITNASASSAAKIDLFEDTDNGTNKVTLIAPASVTSDKTITLPDATDTLVGKATTDTLTNKTLTSPIIDTPIIRDFDGWQEANETWTYASATTFTISGDKTGKYKKGDKIKLTQTTVKYFYIVSVSYSSPNTTVTVIGGNDYSLANAAITSPYYSKVDNPHGFPEYMTSSTGRSRWQIVGGICHLYIWTFITGDGANRLKTLAITYPFAFTDVPVVTISFIGAKLNSDPATIDELTTSSPSVHAVLDSVTTSNLNATIARVSTDGNDPGVLTATVRYGIGIHLIGKI